MQQHRPKPAPHYRDDFYAWTQHQAKLLRVLEKVPSRDADGLDIPHLAEEIEDLGKAELRGATGLIKNILTHLIKAASHPKAPAFAHWRTEVTAFHQALPDWYAPSMRQHIDIQRLWKDARTLAASELREHGQGIGARIPGESPFALADLLDEEFTFDATVNRLQKLREA